MNSDVIYSNIKNSQTSHHFQTMKKLTNATYDTLTCAVYGKLLLEA